MDNPTVLTRWGLLGPDGVALRRRIRPLGLGAAVRAYNEFAVPGLGGVFCVKPLLTACLGIATATRGRRHSNIEVANALEALGCRLEFDSQSWQRDFRLRGSSKLRGDDEPMTFARLRRPSYYVTQPMRMQTVQPLKALGFVESASERFNAYALSEHGEALLSAYASQYTPHHKALADAVADWTEGVRNELKGRETREALSPCVVAPAAARQFLREALFSRSQQRRDALQWVDYIRRHPASVSLDAKPSAISDIDHWNDIRAGAAFFRARDAALAILDAVEGVLGTSSAPRAPVGTFADDIDEQCTDLKIHCRTFLDIDAGVANTARSDAVAFCRAFADAGPSDTLRGLVQRDGRVLVLRANDEIAPGPAFRGRRGQDGEVGEDEGVEELPERRVPWPPGISRRLDNLFFLSLDLDGEVDSWLSEGNADE